MIRSETKPARSQRTVGYLQLGAGAALISFSAVFVKLAHVGPTTAGFYRVLFGGIMLLIVLAIRRERLFQGLRHTALLAICGLIFALDLTLWHRSIHYIGPGLATLIANFQVFFLAFIGVLGMGERVTWKLTLSISMAMVGLYLLVGLNWNALGVDYKTGVILGLITALCYTAYILTLRKSQSGPGTGSGFSAIAIISVFSVLFLGMEARFFNETLAIPDYQTWFALVGYGFCGQVLGWVLISRGLPKVEASRAGLILLLQPTLAFIWDMLFFARPTVPLEILGALLALLGIYLGTVSRSS